MSVIYVLLAISIAVAILFFIAFIVSVKSGQYDDSYTPSVRMLFEDELVKSTTEKQHSVKVKNVEISTSKTKEKT
ncbi:cbb3-type cytochrome oxidase assembly protein CcoS [Maribacter sp.]|nr:cbb3-type cytochrome oxidase assembly protein CcoS [Maribacter sp.]